MDFALPGEAESSWSMEAVGSAFLGDSLDRCSLCDSTLIVSIISPFSIPLYAVSGDVTHGDPKLRGPGADADRVRVAWIGYLRASVTPFGLLLRV